MFVPCKDYWLTNDRDFYTEELEKMEEIDKVEYMWIRSQPDYNVGTYLSSEIKFVTKYSDQWKTNEAFRKQVWDKLLIKKTCPE